MRVVKVVKVQEANLHVVGEDHCDVVHVNASLRLQTVLGGRVPARDSVQVRQGVKQYSGLWIQEADAALAVRSSRAQHLELVERLCNNKQQ